MCVSGVPVSKRQGFSPQPISFSVLASLLSHVFVFTVQTARSASLCAPSTTFKNPPPLMVPHTCTPTRMNTHPAHVHTPIALPLCPPGSQSPASAAKLPEPSHRLMGYLSPCLSASLSALMSRRRLSAPLLPTVFAALSPAEKFFRGAAGQTFTPKLLTDIKAFCSLSL